MIGQWFAAGSGLDRRWFGPGLALLNLGDIRIQIFKAQRQLIGIEPFRPAPEPHALQLFDDLLEPLDLAVTVVDQRDHVAHQTVQQRRVMGQIVEIEPHGRS